MSSLWHTIGENIAAATGQDFTVRSTQAMGGGCINQAYRIRGDAQDFFVKLNTAANVTMFEAEAMGLRALAAAAAIKVPRAICWGSTGDRAYLVLEYLSLGHGGARSMEILGRQLAQLHRTATADLFGWDRDNTIGSTPQINTLSEDWITFWRQQRLGFQLQLAARQGYNGTLQRQGERLLANLDNFFRNYNPIPALLHGDLWSGNVATDTEGNPVIFDPAVYYGDREADLAMTELFGGFSSRFYAAYGEAYPLNKGYPMRRTLYNLYHILNHLNIFGRGYLGRAEQMLETLLAEVD